jgi:Fe-S-cluster containining protein
MPEQLFYTQGLRFSCTRCSSCCRFDPGFVFLSESDRDRLAAALKMNYIEFVETYCRWVPGAGGLVYLSLKEKADYDCVFWKKGCAVYEARPRQCRTFPFWPANLESREAWDEAARSCPGMGQGTLHGPEHIAACLARERAESAITMKKGVSPA